MVEWRAGLLESRLAMVNGRHSGIGSSAVEGQVTEGASVVLRDLDEAATKERSLTAYLDGLAVAFVL